MNHKFCLFDAPLLNNFSQISTTENADLTKVFENTLVERQPVNAVTVVMNHDTQPGQTVETPVASFFKPLAYALILLREKGYPCLFYGDLYGMKGKTPEDPSCEGKLPQLALARKLYAYGKQIDYFDDGEKNCIGFNRQGTADRPDGLACVMSNAGVGQKKMFVGPLHTGEIWTDVLGWEEQEVEIDQEGYGMFPCPNVKVAVFVNKAAKGREEFDKLNL